MGEGLSRGVVLTMRRRRATVFCLLLWMAAAADASLFRRKRNMAATGGHEKSGQAAKGSRGGKRGKVKDDVAWLLEDTSDGGWKPVRDDGHVQVWKRSMPNSDFVAIKSKASLGVSPEALFEVLTPGDIEIVRQYNPLVEDGNDLEVIDRDNKVSWSATMGIWPCRPRDFVTHIQRATLDDGSVAIVNSATTHSKAPVQSKYVRGEILHGVFHIKAGRNKKHSEFTMVHHFNPGGNIPPWLMNWLAEGKPLTFVRKLEKVAEKWDKQAALSKSMPCKGRGFADKPCAFLLPTADGSDHKDPSISGGSPTDDSEWGSPLKILTLAALVWYGWRVFAGWPEILGEKEKCSSAVTAERKVPTEKSCALAVADVAHASPAAQEEAEPIKPKESANCTPEEMSAEAMACDEDDDEKGVAGDPNLGEAQDLGGDRGGVRNSKGPATEGNVAIPCPVELTCGALADEDNAEPTPVAAAVVETADGELPEKGNLAQADDTELALPGRLDPKSSPVIGKVPGEELFDAATSNEVDGHTGNGDVVVGEAAVEAAHDEVAPAGGNSPDEACGGGQTTAGETNAEADVGLSAAKIVVNGTGLSAGEMQRGQATNEGVRPVSLVPQELAKGKTNRTVVTTENGATAEELPDR